MKKVFKSLLARKIVKRLIILIITIIGVSFVIFALIDSVPEPILDKPVIYLYPTEITDITVRLNFDGELLFTYPLYRDGWSVTAHPDGICSDRMGRR